MPLVFAALFAAIDFFTGPYILFPVLFVLPVMLMGWNLSWRWSVGLAVVLCLVRFTFHFFWEAPVTNLIAGLNAVLHFTVLGLLATLTSRLSKATQSLRERVRALEGILPICSFCKAIRDEDGTWHMMEAYVSKRSNAQFSHGVCPTCGEKHYGLVSGRP